MHVPEAALAWVHQMVAEGKARWNGGKPKGASKPIRLRPGSKLAADMIIEDRGGSRIATPAVW